MGQLTEKRGTTQKIVAAWLQIGKKKKNLYDSIIFNICGAFVKQAVSPIHKDIFTPEREKEKRTIK